MNKLLQAEYKKLDRDAYARLMADLNNQLPKDLVKIILSYVSQYGRYTFSRLNLRVRYWQHIDMALCYNNKTIFIKSFEDVDNMYIRENSINSFCGGHVYHDSIASHAIFRKHMFEWHGKRLCVNEWLSAQ